MARMKTVEERPRLSARAQRVIRDVGLNQTARDLNVTLGTVSQYLRNGVNLETAIILALHFDLPVAEFRSDIKPYRKKIIKLLS